MFKKYEVIPWEDFFAGNSNIRQRKGKNSNIMALSVTAAAATANKDMIINAFWPIIDLVQGISYPVTFLMITGGMLLIITGNRTRGLEMIKWAIVGYIGLQFVPAIMKILLDVGTAMRTGHSCVLFLIAA